MNSGHYGYSYPPTRTSYIDLDSVQYSDFSNVQYSRPEVSDTEDSPDGQGQYRVQLPQPILD